MASETEASLSALIDRLMSMTLPFITGETAGSESDGDHDSDHRNPSRDRIILINPLTQSMTVIGGSSTGFDSLLNELTRRNGQPPASQASIDAMPSVEVTGTDEIEGLGGECVICLEEWGVGDVAKEMPCKHKFHGGCVEKWLKIHGSCPVCRHKMPVDDLSKKIGDENGERRREIWVTFSISSGRSSEEERTSQESSNGS